MEEPFVLEVTHKGVKHEIPAQLQLLGYIHRFKVSLPQIDIWFERDEEGSYRAIVPPGTDDKVAEKLDRELISAMVEQIETILR